MSTISNQQLMERQPINYQSYYQFNSRLTTLNESKSEELESKNNSITKNLSEQIDYHEYIEYCSKNAVASDLNYGKTVVQKSDTCGTVQPLHIARAMSTYAKADTLIYQGKIDSEA